MARRRAARNAKRAAKNAKQPKQENHKGNAPLTLETLPPKIISMILATMAVDPDEPYVLDRSTLVPPFVRRDPKPSAARLEADASARRDLASLCLVSMRMTAEARPALYRNILIRDADTLFHLYRTFLEKPQFGMVVKRMTLDICHGGTYKNGSHYMHDLVPPIDIRPLLSHPQHGFRDQFRSDCAYSDIAYCENAYCENTYCVNAYRDRHCGQALREEGFCGKSSCQRASCEHVHCEHPFCKRRYCEHVLCRSVSCEVTVERLYTLQFRVLSHTSKLESLDFNVHPIARDSAVYMPDIYREVITRVIPILREETVPYLSSLKELKMIGKDEFIECSGTPNRYAAWIFRCFLALPKLQRFVWYNHDPAWFDSFFPRRMLEGPNERLRADAESIRVLSLTESPCLPHDLAALCAMFPSLESLSVDTDSEHCRERIKEFLDEPLQLLEKGDASQGLVKSGLITLFLTNTLGTLQNLTTLNLDLHYACNISRSLGPSGSLSLAGLPNLQTLAVPFHFFVRRDPGGHHRAASPSRVLPRALKTLRIVVCFWCLGHRIYENPKFVECFCGAYRIRGYASDRAPCRYQHPDAVLGFLEGIASLRAESFPGLRNIFYDESKSPPVTHQHRTWECPHPPTEVLMHGIRDTPDALRLTAVSEALRQGGVLFKMRATDFGCRVPWIWYLPR